MWCWRRDSCASYGGRNGTELCEGDTWPASCRTGKAGMASKNKGGRSSKTPAAKTAKEKRVEKQEKKTRKGFAGRDD